MAALAFAIRMRPRADLHSAHAVKKSRLATERVERKLAAILAADIAGYSRLMGADEEGTLARLKAHRRELIDPKIAEHRWRIVKTTGDGVLVEFASVVDAVRYAAEVQREMVGRNTVVPADRRIEFRKGVNLGDLQSGTALASVFRRGYTRTEPAGDGQHADDQSIGWWARRAADLGRDHRPQALDAGTVADRVGAVA
jgi:class 3 adenylate cyclase